MKNVTQNPVNKAKSNENSKKPIKLLPFGMAMRWYRKIYDKNGFKTLPLSRATLGDPKTGKTPLTPHGYKDATADYKIFDSFLKPHQEYNIGIPTGLSSGIIVFDIDRRNGGFKSLETLEREYGKLPSNAKVITGDGEHIYLKCPPQGLKSAKIANGIDLIAEGKYVVAPPSLHHTGAVYRWKYLPRNNDSFANLPIAWLRFITKGLVKESGNEEFSTL